MLPVRVPAVVFRQGCPPGLGDQAQEAFLEGHVAAFEVTGGVPCRQVRYDNLSPAVAKVLAGRSRTETTRWPSFRAHYKSVPASSPSSLAGEVLLAVS